MATEKAPTHNVMIRHSRTRQVLKAGMAWLDEDSGEIKLHFFPCVVFDSNNPDTSITLFPITN